MFDPSISHNFFSASPSSPFITCHFTFLMMAFGHICIPPKLMGRTGVAVRRLKQSVLAENRERVAFWRNWMFPSRFYFLSSYPALPALTGNYTEISIFLCLMIMWQDESGSSNFSTYSVKAARQRWGTAGCSLPWNRSMISRVKSNIQSCEGRDGWELSTQRSECDIHCNLEPCVLPLSEQKDSGWTCAT